jgi:hypothetical protein
MPGAVAPGCLELEHHLPVQLAFRAEPDRRALLPPRWTGAGHRCRREFQGQLDALVLDYAAMVVGDLPAARWILRRGPAHHLWAMPPAATLAKTYLPGSVRRHLGGAH